MRLEKIVKEALINNNYEVQLTNDLLYLFVNNTQVYNILLQLKQCSFEILIDCFAENATDNETINVYYHLLSYKYKDNICVYTNINDKLATSIINIFPNANWYEREMYEMYNIEFIGHDNLKKLFTDNK